MQRLFDGGIAVLAAATGAPASAQAPPELHHSPTHGFGIGRNFVIQEYTP